MARLVDRAFDLISRPSIVALVVVGIFIVSRGLVHFQLTFRAAVSTSHESEMFLM